MDPLEVLESGIVGGTAGKVHYIKVAYRVKDAHENPLGTAIQIQEKVLEYFTSMNK